MTNKHNDGHDPYKALPVRPGDQIHVTRSVIFPVRRADPNDFTGGLHELVERGTTITLTSELLEAARNEDGSYGIYEHVGEPDAILGLGPWPADISPLEPADPRWAIARDEATREARSIPDRQAQQEALAQVERRFGPAMATSRTTRVVKPTED